MELSGKPDNDEGTLHARIRHRNSRTTQPRDSHILIILHEAVKTKEDIINL